MFSGKMERAAENAMTKTGDQRDKREYKDRMFGIFKHIEAQYKNNSNTDANRNSDITQKIGYNENHTSLQRNEPNNQTGQDSHMYCNSLQGQNSTSSSHKPFLSSVTHFFGDEVNTGEAFQRPRALSGPSGSSSPARSTSL